MLRLVFYDAHLAATDQVVFDLALAKQVLEFLRVNMELDELVIHCDLGISRSAALALFIRDCFGLPVFRKGGPVDPRYSLYNPSDLSPAQKRIHRRSEGLTAAGRLSRDHVKRSAGCLH